MVKIKYFYINRNNYFKIRVFEIVINTYNKRVLE